MINFRHNGIGNDMLTEILKELNSNFDGKKWANNGPGAITRMILKTCNFKNVSRYNIHVLCTIINIYNADQRLAHYHKEVIKKISTTISY